MVIATSYGLRLDRTMKLELGRSHWKVEDKWHHSWSECIWDEMHEGLWAIYKGIEVQEIYLETLNQRNLRNKKSWNIELKKQKVSIFFYFLLWLKSISILFSNSVPHGKTSYFHAWGLSFYIYIVWLMINHTMKL